MAESRAKNFGLSSAYDSVFRAPDLGDDPEEEERKKRMKVNRKGKVTMMSKKEAAKMEALEVRPPLHRARMTPVP